MSGTGGTPLSRGRRYSPVRPASKRLAGYRIMLNPATSSRVGASEVVNFAKESPEASSRTWSVSLLVVGGIFHV